MCRVRVRAVRHHVVASTGSETTNNSWPQTAACFWNCVSVGVCVCECVLSVDKVQENY